MSRSLPALRSRSQTPEEGHIRRGGASLRALLGVAACAVLLATSAAEAGVPGAATGAVASMAVGLAVPPLGDVPPVAPGCGRCDSGPTSSRSTPAWPLVGGAGVLLLALRLRKRRASDPTPRG